MAAKKDTEISVMRIERGRIDFAVRGATPLICHAMSQKVQRDLLLPPAKKNAAEKASSLKHQPLQEFRASMYNARDPESPTRIIMPAVCFKKAIMGAALDIPGSSKAQIGRLVSIGGGPEVSIFGIPQLMMSVTRSADINRTPDVRTRAILPEWACFVSVEYTVPLLKEQAIVNLMAAAGVMNGIGDWRVQKGSGNFGQYELVEPDEDRFKRIVAEGGKEAQDEAIKQPECYDSETEELIAWFDTEVKRRGFKVVA